jgi:hypothetical protein
LSIQPAVGAALVLSPAALLFAKYIVLSKCK